MDGRILVLRMRVYSRNLRKRSPLSTFPLFLLPFLVSTQIHPTAIIDAKTDLGVEVKIGPYAIIEAGCVIGDYTEVRAHAVIGKGTLNGASATRLVTAR